MPVTSTSSVKRISERRILIYGLAALAAQCLVLAISGFRYYALADRSAPMVGADFVIFWSAARVALEHGAAAVFSAHWMRPIESALWPHESFAPWPYPPTFLLVVLPLGLLSFGLALIVFLAIGIAAYGATIARIAHKINRSAFIAMVAFPGVAVAIITGQNSLLTTAIAGGALALLSSSPILAGACIAALTIKPQFGILFPVALICGREWKALASAGVCSIAFVGISALALGREAWIAFASFLPEFNRIAIEHGHELWSGMPTLFAVGRFAGLSVRMAYITHAVVAVPAAIAMAYLWVKGARLELRAAALVVTTLLVQPYFMYYDLAWLALPIVFLLRDAETVALGRVESIALAAAWMMPAVGFFASRFDIHLQLAPAILVGLLAIILRRHFSGTR